VTPFLTFYSLIVPASYLYVCVFFSTLSNVSEHIVSLSPSLYISPAAQRQFSFFVKASTKLAGSTTFIPTYTFENRQIATMQLSILVITFLLSGVLAIAGNARRDEFQPTDASLTCMFMTNNYHWHGEGQNICEIAGQCGKLCP